VILISSSLEDQRNYFQLYIGASRARLKVYLLVEEDLLQEGAPGNPQLI
jgi:hypothetical protein